MIYGNKIIMELVKGKDVLDIGSCGEQGGEIKPKILYSMIKQKAASVTGVDIQSNTPEIIRGNAETIQLNKKFDVIVAGDVIEHLNNPGQFVINMKDHLKPDGRFIVLTPNIKAIGYLPFKGNRFHKMWWCRNTLTYLLEDNGWRIDTLQTGLRRPNGLIYDALRNYFANTLIVVAKMDNNNNNNNNNNIISENISAQHIQPSEQKNSHSATPASRATSN